MTRRALPLPPAEQGASALVMVIFVMVVLALLLAALAYINSASNQNTALQIASTRAYWAAQSGAEWGVYQVTSNNASCASQTILSYSNTPNAGLAGCMATVACSSAPTASVTSYRISSQGSCPAGNLGIANGTLGGTRSVIVGITASSGATSCAQCAAQNCGYSEVCIIPSICFPNYPCGTCVEFGIGCNACFRCLKKNCNSACFGGPTSSSISTYTLSYWLETP